MSRWQEGRRAKLEDHRSSTLMRINTGRDTRRPTEPSCLDALLMGRCNATLYRTLRRTVGGLAIRSIGRGSDGCEHCQRPDMTRFVGDSRCSRSIAPSTLSLNCTARRMGCTEHVRAPIAHPGPAAQERTSQTPLEIISRGPHI